MTQNLADLKPMSPEPMTFEKTLEQLQVTVRRLESGELSMDEALQAFEQGVQLARTGQQMLAVAEQRVEQLMQISADGRAETRPFASSGNPNENSGGPRS
jgi:exodeoxyribonuclease VII small subunit